MDEQDTNHKYGDGYLYKKARSPFWYMQYSLRGKRYRETTKERDFQKAQKVLRHRLKEVGADQIGVKKFVGPRGERLTVIEILDVLVTDLELRKKLSPQAISKIKPVRAALGVIPAMQVDDDLIRDYTRVRLTGAQKVSREKAKGAQNQIATALLHAKRPRAVSNATVNREMGYLIQAYNLKAKVIGHPPKIPKLDERVREGFLERAEFELILKHLPKDLQDFARWGYLTGWRKGEISSLRWSELNMEARQLRLRAQFSKNAEARTVPLMGELWELVQRRWKARRYKGENGETILSPLVFFRLKGRGEPKPGGSVKQFRKAWKAACEAAGKPEALFHDFRRTAVRNMIRAGVDRKVAMMVSGHKTESIFNRYNITDDRDLEEAIRKTDAYVSQLPKERENPFGKAAQERRRKQPK
jgi:integrase